MGEIYYLLLPRYLYTYRLVVLDYLGILKILVFEGCLPCGLEAMLMAI